MSAGSTNPPPKKAPVSITGGQGFEFEDYAAARIMVDMLLQANSFGSKELGVVTRLDWQVRDKGWLADDLAVTSKIDDEERSVGISVKSGYRVTSNGFPSGFVDSAWNQWRTVGTARKFSSSEDAIALITGDGTDTAKGPWNALLKETLSSSPERVSARVAAESDADGIQIGSIGRSIFHSFQKKSSASPEDAVETAALVKKVRWLDFDFGKTNSTDYDRAIGDCQRLLASGDISEAKSLWNELVSISGELQ